MQFDPTLDLPEHPSPGRALFVRSVSAGESDDGKEGGKEAAEGKGASEEELASFAAEAAAVRRALIMGKGEGKGSDNSTSDDGWSFDDDSSLSGSASDSDVASDEWEDARDSSGSEQRPRPSVCCPKRHPLVRVQAACAGLHADCVPGCRDVAGKLHTRGHHVRCAVANKGCCDMCNMRVAVGTVLYRCRICNWDACDGCRVHLEAGNWAILCERVSTAEDSEGLIEALEDIDMLVRRSRGGRVGVGRGVR